ncbi:cGMP-specific 3',5'-cyclic phosphodiesterase [Cichlidogyrus casuarinus]|uniref:cGMP-specific 3',5'-cyclic phosphodiesterase n=1 Tax=Cichlidogyrus casuarinus TaxID=1844966 RepID=A0ABD2Q3S4_9PLAT
MFIDLNLLEIFKIPRRALCRWLLSVKKNYRQVTYHNWRHAFNVAQTMFSILTTANFCTVFEPHEQLAMLIACLSHDLDHRGTNNQFQIKTMSPLADLYSTSVLEHHHFDQCIMLLNTKDYARIIELIEKCILATDLSSYFGHLTQFKALLGCRSNNEYIIPTSPSHSLGSAPYNLGAIVNQEENLIWRKSLADRDLLSSMLMTACDISAITKPWPIQKKTAELVSCEFFQQGDLERNQLNIEPMFIMDRSQSDKLPKMQIDFINSICLPCYESVTILTPQLQPLLEGCRRNLACWTAVQKNLPIPTDTLMALTATTSDANSVVEPHPSLEQQKLAHIPSPEVCL